MSYAVHNTEPDDMGIDPEITAELVYVSPICMAVLDAYDPERDGAGARVTRTDYALAEAITTLQSMVERQAVQIQRLTEALAELTK